MKASKTNKPPPPPKDRISIPIAVAEDTEAKREWIRLVMALGDKLDARDRSLLEDYCLTHSEIIMLRRSVTVEGHTLTSDKGNAYINPTVNLLISRQSHLASLRRDLYFTPKSRQEKQVKATISKANSIKNSLNTDEEENNGD